MTQKSVPRNDRDAEIEDLRSRLEAAYEHVAKQNEAIIQMTFEHEAEENSHEIVTHLEGKVELYQFQVSIYILYHFAIHVCLFNYNRLCVYTFHNNYRQQKMLDFIVLFTPEK